MAVALIVAAGRGERLGSGRPKALVPLCGRPMLEWSVAALQAVPAVTQIVVALPADELGGAPAGTLSVPGGLHRSHSVRNALAHATDEELARATDDAWLVERAGGSVRILGADPGNMKITTAEDLRVAELLLSELRT